MRSYLLLFAALCSIAVTHRELLAESKELSPTQMVQESLKSLDPRSEEFQKAVALATKKINDGQLKKGKYDDGATLPESLANYISDIGDILGQFFSCSDMMVIGICVKKKWGIPVGFAPMWEYRLPLQQVEIVDKPNKSAYRLDIEINVQKPMTKALLDMMAEFGAKQNITSVANLQREVANRYLGQNLPDTGSISSAAIKDGLDAVKSMDKYRGGSSAYGSTGVTTFEYHVIPSAVGFIFGAMNTFNQIRQLGSQIEGLGATVTNATNSASNFFADIGGSIKDGATKLGDTIADIPKIPGKVIDSIGKLPSEIGSSLNNAGTSLTTATGDLIKTVQDAPKKVGGIAGNIGSAIKNTTESISSTMGGEKTTAGAKMVSRASTEESPKGEANKGFNLEETIDKGVNSATNSIINAIPGSSVVQSWNNSGGDITKFDLNTLTSIPGLNNKLTSGILNIGQQAMGVVNTVNNFGQIAAQLNMLTSGFLMPGPFLVFQFFKDWLPFQCHNSKFPGQFCSDGVTGVLHSRIGLWSYMSPTTGKAMFNLYGPPMVHTLAFPYVCAALKSNKTPLSMILSDSPGAMLHNLRAMATKYNVEDVIGCLGVNQESWALGTNTLSTPYPQTAAATLAARAIMHSSSTMPGLFYKGDFHKEKKERKDRYQWTKSAEMKRATGGKCIKLEQWLSAYGKAQQIKSDEDYLFNVLHWKYFRCCPNKYEPWIVWSGKKEQIKD